MVSGEQAPPNLRPRVCAAIMRGKLILLVHHVHGDGRSYWTMPGGAVEPGESLTDAAVREVYEETGMHARVIRQLYERPYSMGIETCFLAVVEDGQEPRLGADPEEQDLPADHRILRGVAWKPLENIKSHPQAVWLLRALSQIKDRRGER